MDGVNTFPRREQPTAEMIFQRSCDYDNWIAPSSRTYATDATNCSRASSHLPWIKRWMMELQFVENLPRVFRARRDVSSRNLRLMEKLLVVTQSVYFAIIIYEIFRSVDFFFSQFSFTVESFFFF